MSKQVIDKLYSLIRRNAEDTITRKELNDELIAIVDLMEGKAVVDVEPTDAVINGAYVNQKPKILNRDGVKYMYKLLLTQTTEDK